MTTTHDTTRHDTTRKARSVDLWTLGHHLSIARARYEEDEKVMREAGERFFPVAETFARMAEECRALEALLTMAEDVDVTLIGESLTVSGEMWT